MIFEEYMQQRALVRWFRYQYPKEVFFMINNGTRVTPAMGAILKLMGLLKGMPDLMLAYPSGRFHGLFIEMKRKGKGFTSYHQKEVHATLTTRGYLVMICYDFEEAKEHIERYIKDSKTSCQWTQQTNSAKE